MTKMVRVNTTEFRRNIKHYVEQAEGGTRVFITRRQKLVIAELVPVMYAPMSDDKSGPRPAPFKKCSVQNDHVLLLT